MNRIDKNLIKYLEYCIWCGNNHGHYEKNLEELIKFHKGTVYYKVGEYVFEGLPENVKVFHFGNYYLVSKYLTVKECKLVVITPMEVYNIKKEVLVASKCAKAELIGI